MTVDSYDQIPYDSAPIYETHPAQLALLGALFGMHPAAPTHCRYLELGCASGGNIIPLAYALPDSEIIGIERSAEQAAAGQALIATLGLSNARIVQADVLDLDFTPLGPFDYVVAHGFYSWVPAAVRASLFRILADQLTPQGIGYVSYNVYPGWRWRGMVRELLRHQVRGLRGPRERLTVARAAIEQYAAALAGRQDPVSTLVREELLSLRTRHPSYLYHEYLVDENTPQLFSEFMAEATRHGLQYLCESELHTMFADGLGETAQALVDASDDIIEQEQTLDFLRNRLFRQTLLCRSDVTIQRELDLERFAGLAYHASLTPAEVPDLTRANDQVFVMPEGDRCIVRHPLAKAAVLELAAAHPSALAFNELAARAAQRVRRAGGPATEHEALLVELLQLFLHQIVGGLLQAEPFTRPEWTWPCASPLARAQVAAGTGHVATARHKPMELDPFVARLITYLDGTRERTELVELLQRDLESGRLTLEGEAPKGAALTAMLAANIDRVLTMLAHQGVLVPVQAGR